MKDTILYFFDYGVSFGGAVNTLMQQMLLIKNAGYCVHGFVSGYSEYVFSDEYQKIFEKKGIVLEHLNYTICSHTEDIDIIGVLECYEEVKKAILKYEPILIHSVQINPTVELVSRELGIPHIMDIYQADPDFFAIPYTNIFPQYHICDSECYAKAWSGGLGIRSECIRTVVNEFIPRRNIICKDVVKFICVGQITKRKNQLEVIKGFHNAVKKGIKGILYLYGYDKEEYAKECMNYVQSNGIESYVKFCGFSSSMVNIYAESDVLICGSKIESYPNVISEALANGVIVISSPVAGVPEVIQNRVNGYLSDGYSADDFEKSIEECYSDFSNDSIYDIWDNANRTFEQVHSEKKVTEDLLDFYKSVVEQKIEKKLIDKNSLQKMFQDIIDIYMQKKTEFKYPQIVRKKLWYLYHVRLVLKEYLKNENRIFIWGTGKMSICVMELWKTFFDNIRIDGFVDSYKVGNYLGYTIKKPEEIIYDRNNIILIALSKGIDDVYGKLKQAERIYGKDYFLLVPRVW